MTKRCIVMFSGGLDSMLSVRIMQEQGVDVVALTVRMMFECCDKAEEAARELGVPLVFVEQGDDYFELLRSPKFGFGRGVNPCVDCRIYLLEQAKKKMEELNADFVVTGEVIGQRPKSQKRNDLFVVSQHCGLNDLLLRPLSAKLLPPTKPEIEGWVDREKLYSFQGRRRTELGKLGIELGLKKIPGPSVGCALTEVHFAPKARDLLKYVPDATRWDFELLKTGRHFRYDDLTRIVVGHNNEENLRLAEMHNQPEGNSTALLTPNEFMGPNVLLIGPVTDESAAFAAGLLLRYAKKNAAKAETVTVTVRTAHSETSVTPQITDAIDELKTMTEF